MSVTNALHAIHASLVHIFRARTYTHASCTVLPRRRYGDALRQPIRVELCTRNSAGGEEAVAFGEAAIDALGFGEFREVGRTPPFFDCV